MFLTLFANRTRQVNGELFPGELTIESLADLVGFDLKSGKPTGVQIKPPPIDVD